MAKGVDFWVIQRRRVFTNLPKPLLKENAIPGFEIKTAVNLDGGSSSTLWVQDGARSLYLPGEDKIANYLGVIPK